jgi:RecA-family ATPase
MLKQPKQQTIAQEIAKLFPNSLFCGFRLVTKENGKVAKIPVSKRGDGVSRDMSRAKEELVTAKELIDGYPPLGDYWGVVLQDPIYDPFNSFVLTVLDLDTKNSETQPNLQIKKLIELSKERNLLYEASHSGKGAHIMFLSEPDATLPKKIVLGSNQEIEIFGHPSGGGKSVMLTGNKMRGDLNSVQNVRELLEAAGIDIDKKVEPRRVEPVALQRKYNLSEQMSLARDALEYMNADMHYDDWVKVGMALVAEFGAEGEDLWLEWSKTGNSWDESNINKAKSFKGQGVGMGTFFHMADEAGWRRPTRGEIERTTASQDFAQFIHKVEEAKEDPAVAMEMAQELVWKPLELDFSRIKGIDYVIDGFLSESFSVVAGQPGAGKTTAMVSLALIAAGFPLGELSAVDSRKIIYVSEDPDQVRRILHAFIKFEGIDKDALQSKFVLIEAKRVNAAVLSKLRENVLLETEDNVRPWLILDTASAIIRLRDENDNAGVAEFVACLKEDIFLGMNTPITIIAHMNKVTNRNDEDGQARGASAWEGDATLTATLFVDDDVRYLKLRKTRYEPLFREIRFDIKQDSIAGFDSKNRLQDINLTWAIPFQSDEQERKIMKAERNDNEKNQRQQNIVDQAHTEFLRYIQQFDNPVIQAGAGRRKAPDNVDLINLDEWLKTSGIDGMGKTATRRSVAARVKAMFGAENLSGFVPLKVFVPKGTNTLGQIGNE